MRRYVGSPLTAYAAIAAPCLSLFCLGFGIFAIISEISPATCFVFILGVSVAVAWVLYIKKISKQLYSWACFGKEKVSIKGLLSKLYEIEYSKCRSVGIGFYVHGYTSPDIGIRQWYIYFSYDLFEEKYKAAINHWHINERRLKVGFDKRLYKYLLKTLPQAQAVMLERDYNYVQQLKSESKKKKIREKKKQSVK